jgi:hypothetical protein
MGQRNATYIITEDARMGKEILPIYNQWNYIKIQLPKILRGILAVLKINWEWVRLQNAAYVYFAAAGTNKYKEDNVTKVQWVGGNIELDEYNKAAKCYTGGFQEDNNNGWNILKFKLDKHDKLIIELYCVVGSEDEEKAKSDTIDTYFYECTKYQRNKLKKLVKWNPKLKDEAGDMLRALHVKSLTAADKKKISLQA